MSIANDINNPVEIKYGTVSKQGKRGLAVRLPSIWHNKHRVQPSQRILFLATAGSSDLIIRLEKSDTENTVVKS